MAESADDKPFLEFLGAHLLGPRIFACPGLINILRRETADRLRTIQGVRPVPPTVDVQIVTRSEERKGALFSGRGTELGGFLEYKSIWRLRMQLSIPVL